MAVLFQQSNTLNQLNAMFAEIAGNIDVFNGYGEGEVKEINAVTTNNYPLLWCEVNPVSIHETFTTYNYRVYTMDLIFPDLSNRMEVQSDALTSLHHVLYTVRDTYNIQIQWNSLTATPFIQQFNDMVGGWYIDVKIDIPWSFGSCDIPLRHAVDYNWLINYDGSYIYDYNNDNILTF